MGAVFEVMDGSSEALEISNPSVSRLSGKVGVVWEEYNSELLQRYVRYRERASNGTWGSLKAWKSGQAGVYYYTPTISTHTGSIDNVMVAWRVGTSDLNYVKKTSSGWGLVQWISTGSPQAYDPTLSLGLTSSNTEMIGWRMGSTAPYDIALDQIEYIIPSRVRGNIAEAGSEGIAIPGRGGKIIFDHGFIELAILRANIDEDPITFVALNDTIPIETRQDLESFLVSDPFQGTGTLTLELLYSAAGEIPPGVSFRGQLKDAVTGQTLATVRTFSGLQDSILTVTIPVDYRSRSLKICLQAVGALGARSFVAEEWFIDDGGDSLENTTMSLPAGSSLTEEIPTRYYLHQNYPNPFNPETAIEFELPENATVSLKVYDILGKEVAEVIDGFEEAGYHQVSLNAATLASGMYFYRITAGSFTDVKKLVVIK
jgi:hypothetical protein